FRHVHSEGTESVAPRVEYASGLGGSSPRCVVSIIACTGDWTGGWDNSPPGGADRFITAAGERGRLVAAIDRGEPACLLAHWTGIWFNGEEVGFNIFKEVVRRLHARFDHLLWMKLSEIARYWAAKELTRIEVRGDVFEIEAPFATPAFTVRVPRRGHTHFTLNQVFPGALRRVERTADLVPGTWQMDGDSAILCFDLPRGRTLLLTNS